MAETNYLVTGGLTVMTLSSIVNSRTPLQRISLYFVLSRHMTGVVPANICADNISCDHHITSHHSTPVNVYKQERLSLAWVCSVTKMAAVE